MNDPVQEATRAQNASADPSRSTFVSANAGSGKTTILTHRIARLLLAGNQPQSILCLTYTKAAAGEVQERIFKTLGEWVLMDDASLRASLAKIGEAHIEAEKLGKARRLFAQALETPSGLKVQTIHAFCASLLKRFPLEARVPPDFREIDDRESEMLGQMALRALIMDDSVLASKIAARRALSEKFVQEILTQREAFRPDWSAEDFAHAFGCETILPPQELQVRFENYAPLFVMEEWVKTVDHYAVAAFAKFKTAYLAGDFDLELLGKIFVKGDGEARSNTPAPEQKFVGDHPDLAGLVHLAMVELGQALDYDYFHALAELHQFAGKLLTFYAQEKSSRLVLDYDDLIERADWLLNQNDRLNWVMYRLDGAIEHILVDEAQDSNHSQWRIIDALAQGASEGSERLRTLFVVGDEKQSIYSFQGADPDVFETKRVDYRNALAMRGDTLLEEALLVSFRSSPLILDFVDQVFEGEFSAGLGEKIVHQARARDVPGKIEIFPYIFKGAQASKPVWPEIGVVPVESDELALAEEIANKIADEITSGMMIKDGEKWRAVNAGDYLILLRKRRSFFYAVQKALQARGIPIAGVDSFALNDELAVKDVLAFLRALQAPFDDLSMAIYLRSPLAGLSEAALFDLAHERGKKTLVDSLVEAKDQFPMAAAIYENLQAQVDFLRPYDLIAKLLFEYEGEARLRARLGVVVEDALKALLDVALQYESQQAPSLAGFLNWFDAQEIKIKRALSEQSGAVRTMTVHGAKGLEAPIVILPQVEDRRNQEGGMISVNGIALTKGSYAPMSAGVKALIHQVQTKDKEEENRLLYVGLTRARTRLVICGAGKPKSKTTDEFPDYNIYPQFLRAMDAVDGKHSEEASGMAVVSRHWCDEKDTPDLTTPSFLREIEFSPLELDPISRAQGLSELLPDHAPQAGRGQAYGVLFHEMMEVLPLWPEEQWRDYAHARFGGQENWQEAFEEACAVLTAFPDLRAGGLREISFRLELEGVEINGRMDHVSLGDELRLFDFKTNLETASDWSALHPNYQMQLAVYRAALKPLASGRLIRAGILWSHSCQWLEGNENQLDAALDRFRHRLRKTANGSKKQNMT